MKRHNSLFKPWPFPILAWLLLMIAASVGPLLSAARAAESTARVVTDQDDYPPFSFVVITGSGFWPGEVVSNQVVQIEGPAPGAAYNPWGVVADANGNFTTEWLVFSEELLNTTLELTATGQSSALIAKTQFKDSNLQTLTVGAQSPSPVTQGGSATYGVTNTFGGNDKDACIVTLSVSGLPVGASALFSPDDQYTNTTGAGSSVSRILTIATTGATPLGTHSFVVTAARGGDCQGNGNLTSTNTLVVQAACTPPTITCPANIITNNATGTCGQSVSFAPTTTGTSPTVTCTPASGSTFAVGTTTVNCSAVNSCGSASCSFTVTVVDNQPPTAICPANIVTTSSTGADSLSGDCQAQVSYVIPAPTDNCPGASTVCSPASGSMFAVGTSTVTCTGTDATGNSSTCTFTVTVNDDENPTATCPANITVASSAGADGLSGDCQAQVNYAASASDNCPGSTILCSPVAGGLFSVGTTTVNCTATDAAGRTATCSFTVTVTDSEAPTANCPANIVTTSSTGTDSLSGDCQAQVSYVIPAPTDNCPGASTVCSPASGSMFAVGTSTVTCTATDASGNTSTCSFTVTVNDDENPTATCPANITVASSAGADGLSGDCQAQVNYAASASDNCPGATILCSPAAGGLFPVGTTTVNCTATDAAGRTATCSFTVTVTDSEAPTANCPANIVTTSSTGADSLSGDCQAQVSYVIPAPTDNCPGVSTVCSPASGSMFAVGTSTVTCTATDASGNSSTCSFTVTVNDDENPTATCPANITVASSAGADGLSGDCQAQVNYAASASDNCPGATILCSPAAGGLFPVGTTTVNCTATDAAGRTATCSFTVTVTDSEAPTANCPANIVTTSSTGADSLSGDCQAQVSYVIPAPTDNCPGVSTVCSPASGSMFAVGTSTVTCTGTDATGNSSTCTFTVTVNDDENPTATCPANITVASSAGADGLSGDCQAQVNYAASASDNCPGATILCSPAAGGLFPVGTTTVNCTATDAAGRTATCSFTVTVTDSEAPTANCPANIVTTSSTGADSLSGDCQAQVSYVIPAPTDNCPGVSTVCSPASGSMFAVGTSTVTCTGTDASGNSSTCTFTVTVNDDENPTATCPANITVASSAGADGLSGDCQAQVNYTASASDNCPGATILCSPVSGGLFPVGTTTVNCAATDAAGRTATCSFTVTVTDSEAPTANCPANIVTTSSTGTDSLSGDCQAQVSYVIPAPTDNCPGASTVCSPASGSMFAVGTSTVTCTATDASGNSSTCSFTVTVNDDENPTLSCPLAVIVPNDPGMCGAEVTYPVNATDNCPDPATSCTPPSGSFFQKGTTTVNCTATDAADNTATCTFTVTVNDAEAPVAQCQGDITVFNDPGVCGAVVSYAAGATDNCPGASIACSPPSGSTFPLGTNTVNCTAQDAAGTTANCSFEVVVVDNEPPTVSCPANVTVGCSVNALEPISYPAPTASDNCSGGTVVCNPPSGSLFLVGTSNVTCTATDAAGNSASCTFSVTRDALGFTGFLPPIGGADGAGGSFADPLRAFKLGSTIPVKFRLTCGGAPIATGIHTLQATKYSSSTSSDTAVDATPTDAATTGNEFRLTDAAAGEWHFNLSTKSGFSKGIWKLVATLSDGSQHEVWIEIKK